jgi:uncharacterized membrane protein
MVIEWDAETINEVPNTLIAWASAESATVVSAGSVNFDRSLNGGTQVRVRLQYSAPGGKIADAVTRLLGESPAQQIKDDLQRFKMMMESGAAPYMTVGQGQTPESW